MAEIKKLLDDAIETEINNLNSASDKDEKSEVIKNLAALHKLRIEEIKTETEIEEKSERRAMDKAAHDEDATLKAFQLDENTLDRYAKIGIAAAELVLPLMFYGVWMSRGLRFEETGTFTSQTFKNLFNRFKPMCETKSVTSAIYIDRSPDEAAAYINNPDMAIQSEDNLVLDNGHTLQFIGKVGLFSPIKSGCGGGSLVRQNTDKNGNVKYDSVVGTKDYLWMESEMVKILGKEDCIDRRYYDALVDAAATDISKYGDFEWFVSEDPYVSDTPPWFGPGEPHEEDNTPFDVR